jgi:glycosyltransferase involved in cell wall biosynthesis
MWINIGLAVSAFFLAMASILFHDPRLSSVAGGGETVTLQLIELLATEGHEVTVLTRQASQTELFKGAMQILKQVRVVELDLPSASTLSPENLPSNLLRFWEADRLAPESLAFNVASRLFYEESKFDLVVVSFILDLAGISTRDPILLNVFGMPPNQAMADLERPLLGQCSSFIFASHFARREFARLFALGDEAALGPVVHASIHADFFGAPTTGKREFDVCYAGRLHPRKGLHVMLDALGCLKASRGVILSFAAAGDGREREALREQACRIGVEDQVLWQGVLNTAELVELLDRSRVFVYPTLLPEVFGCSNLEAMARGLCVVTTNLGGTADYVKPGMNALVCDPGSASSLADALFTAVTDYALRERISFQARADAQDFRPEVKRAVWLKVFAEAVAHGPRG